MISHASRHSSTLFVRQFSAALAVALSIFLGADSGVARADVVVDNFTDFDPTAPFAFRRIVAAGPSGSNPVVGTPNAVETGLTGVIGGSRHATLTRTAGGQPIIASIGASPGVLGYSAGNSTGNLQLLYNNNGAGLAANVTPFFGISVPLLNLDLGNAPQLDVTATLNDGTNSASDTVTVTTSGGQNLLIPPGAFAGLDLTNIQSILIQFFAGPDTEFDVGAIRILTPEPLAILGWAVVLLVGFAGWRCVASRVRACASA